MSPLLQAQDKKSPVRPSCVNCWCPTSRLMSANERRFAMSGDRSYAPLESGRKLVKFASKVGKAISWKRSNYFYDKKEKIGEYIASGSGKSLWIGLHGGGLGSGECQSSASSMGGYGTWSLGAHHSDVFAGGAAYAGAPTAYFEDETRKVATGIETGVLPSYFQLTLFVFRGPEKMTVLLGAPLVDLEKEISIKIGDKVKFKGKVKRTLSTLLLTLPRHDNDLLFDVRVDIEPKDA